MNEELAIRAVKAFPELFPELWTHQLSRSKSKGVWSWWCAKCKENWVDQPNQCEPICTVPDPIDINWDTAMMLFRKIDKHWGKKTLVKIFVKSKCDVGFGWWLMYIATPADYILAACEAREKENG